MPWYGRRRLPRCDVADHAVPGAFEKPHGRGSARTGPALEWRGRGHDAAMGPPSDNENPGLATGTTHRPDRSRGIGVPPRRSTGARLGARSDEGDSEPRRRLFPLDFLGEEGLARVLAPSLATRREMSVGGPLLACPQPRGLRLFPAHSRHLATQRRDSPRSWLLAVRIHARFPSRPSVWGSRCVLGATASRHGASRCEGTKKRPPHARAAARPIGAVACGQRPRHTRPAARPISAVACGQRPRGTRKRGRCAVRRAVAVTGGGESIE
jgi:hypothetical protein